MKRDQNSFAKRQREMEKKRKAEEKRARRRQKKEHGDDSDVMKDNAGPAENS